MEFRFNERSHSRFLPSLIILISFNIVSEEDIQKDLERRARIAEQQAK